MSKAVEVVNLSGVEGSALIARLVRLERARPSAVAAPEVVMPVLRFTIEVSVTFNKTLVYDNTAIVEGEQPLVELLKAVEAAIATFVSASGLAYYRVRRTISGLASTIKDGAKFTLNQATLAYD